MTEEWFPSREWLERYRENLNENETYDEASEGWGVDFEGDFVFVIQSLPVEETTVGDLPDELTDPLVEALESTNEEEFARLEEAATDAFADRYAERPDGREAFVETLLATPLDDVPAEVWPELRSYLPSELDNLLGQLEEFVHDGTVYAYLDLEDGTCHEVDLLTDPEERDPGFRLAGRYGKWVELIEGADVMESVLSRDMKLDGSVSTVLQYDEAAAEMGDTAGETPATYLF